MSTNYIKQLIEGYKPQMQEAYEIMNAVLSGTVSASLLSSLLTAMRMRGETAEEIAGFALAMRSNSRKFEYQGSALIDLCGTGGDNSLTVNISTIASFIVAGTGIKVAKHGNRAVSSKCGSADLLEALGCSIELNDDQIQNCLNRAGFAFFFAPAFHPAMKFAAPVRQELGFRTIFNMLGPLTNPAGVRRQLTGTFSDAAAGSLAEASTLLDYDEIKFVCTENTIDELLPGSEVLIITVSGKKLVKQRDVMNYPGLNRLNKEGLFASSKEDCVKAFLEIIDNGKESYTFSTAVLNAAMAIVTAQKDKSMETAIEECVYSIKSGAAYRSFLSYKEESNQQQ